MIQFQLLAGIICLCLLYIALFGCKGILPYFKDCKKKKKKSTIVEQLKIHSYVSNKKPTAANALGF